MKFYNIESLMDGEKIKASGVDIRRMSSALEIIGNKTGISVLTKRDIFSSVMEKRNSNMKFNSC